MRTGIVVAAAVMVLVAVRTSGQPAAETPRFEVASIKPGISPYEAGRAAAAGGGTVTLPFFGVRVQPGGRLIASASLQALILRAYGIKDYQLEGGPKWLTTDYFDVAAKAERETATEAEMNDMLKSLLAERFNLRVHVETRQATVFTLKTRADGRLGPGLRRTAAECERQLEERRRTGAPPPPLALPSGEIRQEPACGRTLSMVSPQTASEVYSSGGRPFADLVTKLSNELRAPVIDESGLTGLFDVWLEFQSPRRFADQPRRGPDPNSTDPLPVPLPAAVRQQLGLTLEKGLAPLPITIIDAAEPPSAN